MDIPSLNTEAVAVMEQIDKLNLKKLWEYDSLDAARAKMLELDNYIKGVYEHQGNRCEIMIPSSDVAGKIFYFTSFQLYQLQLICDI